MKATVIFLATMIIITSCHKGLTPQLDRGFELVGSEGVKVEKIKDGWVIELVYTKEQLDSVQNIREKVVKHSYLKY